MDFTKNITLGTTSFLIEEQAYHLLTAYLTELREHLTLSDNPDTLMANTRQRMGEWFTTNSQHHEVITARQVQQLITLWGTPATFASTLAQKRWLRSLTDRRVAGVLGGLARYGGISSTQLRWGYMLLIALFLPFYISVSICAIALYGMLLFMLHTEGDKAASKISIPKILLYVVATTVVTLTLLGAFGGWIAAAVGNFTGYFTLSQVQLFVSHFFTEQWQLSLLYLGFALVNILAVSMLLLIGLKLKKKYFHTPKLWVAANIACYLISTAAFSILIKQSIPTSAAQATVVQRTPLPITADTLTLREAPRTKPHHAVSPTAQGIRVHTNICFDEVLPTTEAAPYMQFTVSASGSNPAQATANAQQVVVPVQVQGNIITLPNAYDLPQGVPFRNQQVRISLFLPKGKPLKIIASNYRRTHGHLWVNFSQAPSALPPHCDNSFFQTNRIIRF